jgi:hypothetical protein
MSALETCRSCGGEEVEWGVWRPGVHNDATSEIEHQLMSAAKAARP